MQKDREEPLISELDDDGLLAMQGVKASGGESTGGSRFALILEMLHWACGESQKQMVGIKAVKGALALVQYFERHALKVQAITSGTNPLLQYPENKQWHQRSNQAAQPGGGPITVGIAFVLR